MKTILVPTDFSPLALGAAIYAAELAKTNSATLILLHAYHPQLPTVGAEFGILPDLDLDKENELLLEDFKRDLLKHTSGNFEIECVVKIGFAVDEIVNTIDEKNPDLIVMGINGEGLENESVLGSKARAILRKTNIPMIMVPADTAFKKPDSVVFACDYKGEVSQKVTDSLKEYLKLFQANLRVLNLEKPEEISSFDKAVTGIQLEIALNDVEHTLHFLPSVADIASEMNDFIDKHKADMLVMVPHHHSLLHRIFNQSTTKHVAFNSHVPILALHE